MTAAELAASATVDDDLADLADLIEGATERAGYRGISPARAARATGCTTAQARQALAYLAGQQRVHTAGTWRHVHAGPA